MYIYIYIYIYFFPLLSVINDEPADGEAETISD